MQNILALQCKNNHHHWARLDAKQTPGNTGDVTTAHVSEKHPPFTHQTFACLAFEVGIQLNNNSSLGFHQKLFPEKQPINWWLKDRLYWSVLRVHLVQVCFWDHLFSNLPWEKAFSLHCIGRVSQWKTWAWVEIHEHHYLPLNNPVL